MLDVVELYELEEELKVELDERLTEILAKLNRTGKLEELLELLSLEHLLQLDSGYTVRNTGKIVIIGQSEVKEEVFLSIIKGFGIDKSRVEICLDYEKAKTYNFKKMQWDPNYCAVLVGPMPHSGSAKGDNGSIISALENEDGYPPVIRLGSNQLKITKSDFKEKFSDCISRKIIA